jgi:succinyl-CoA synthetase beta subunit
MSTTDEGLERQVQEIAEKLQKRNEGEIRKAEQEWRSAMERDTAGETWKMFQSLQGVIAALDALVLATNPLVALARQIAELDARVSTLEMSMFAKSQEAAK